MLPLRRRKRRWRHLSEAQADCLLQARFSDQLFLDVDLTYVSCPLPGLSFLKVAPAGWKRQRYTKEEIKKLLWFLVPCTMMHLTRK